MSDTRLIHGEATRAMIRLRREGVKVDAVVCDPPYELSNDGKASPNRVFLEMMFPENAKVESSLTGGDVLSALVAKVLRLGGVGFQPCPSAAVPIDAVTLDGDSSGGEVDVDDVGEGAVGVADGQGGENVEPEAAEHLGSFALKLTDETALLQLLDRAGTGFFSGRIGVGFALTASSAPGLLRGCGAVPFGGDVVGLGNDPLANLVRALRGAADVSMPHLFHLGGGAVEVLTTDGALVLLSLLQLAGAKLIRTSPAASGLPSMFEARRVRIVHGPTNRTFTLDLVTHTQNITSTGFMGKDWDGSKVSMDAATWKAAYDVLKPGGRLLAFGGARTHHRIWCAVEDAGFAIEDTVAWMYGSGFPKHRSKLKPAWEPVVVARKGGVSDLNIDAGRIANQTAR